MREPPGSNLSPIDGIVERSIWNEVMPGKLLDILSHPHIPGKEADKMEIKCLSCGHSINLDHVIFRNYFGTVKCFTCGSMLEVKTKDGVLIGEGVLVPKFYPKVHQQQSRPIT